MPLPGPGAPRSSSSTAIAVLELVYIDASHVESDPKAIRMHAG